MAGRNEILGIGLESSCDETSAAVVRNGEYILSNCINSQIELHREYSGVVPEIASRAHLEIINDLVDAALRDAGIAFRDLSYAAATARPGLVGSLLIGLQSAKSIAYTVGIPLIAVNHLEAHLYAPFLEGRSPVYPHIGLLISGGNTALFHVRDVGDIEIIGRTTDDAVGEAFDKIAKYLNLGYPGGPVIERIAATASEKKTLFPKILTEAGSGFRFSYSGLKTAVINYIRQNPDTPVNEIVYSFQERALEILVRRVYAAAAALKINTIVIAGGVAANGRLRELLTAENHGRCELIMPSPLLCTDNAAMVAGVAFHYYQRGVFSPLSMDVSARY
jgi:N6-L-threonylcarbamoyladenine synthase